ncbi:Txe/YoeB family addiction module toxin [Pseudomonas sp. MAFF212428]|uniref:Putative mRNA interferase YoeB n=1 Tax=Pseudomonas brassicae TaxID=2708063 RepID=A0A6B3NMI2_9PSED|nr:Txe/YoeB family addiction module toxin [Pseudomonas brassicae]NER58942.1 Txe/YoeB family addiction module toxin [Pseudomonas brassicae]NER63299.1 Txe/YoeB family addiction module toxin [Pseudomonas brassicae]
MSKAKQSNKDDARTLAGLKFTGEAWEDYCHWQQADAKVLANINSLISQCRRTPFSGTGKPEALKGDLSGYWSRRITKEHRLVYFFEANVLTILQCRFHYDD